jgi:hypothetical protein
MELSLGSFEKPVLDGIMLTFIKPAFFQNIPVCRDEHKKELFSEPNEGLASIS